MIQANVGGSERREERGGGGGVCLSEGGGSWREKNEREVYVAMAGRKLTGRRRRRCWTAVEGGGGVVGGGGGGSVKTETGWSLDYCALVLAGAGLAGWVKARCLSVSLTTLSLTLLLSRRRHRPFRAGQGGEEQVPTVLQQRCGHQAARSVRLNSLALSQKSIVSIFISISRRLPFPQASLSHRHRSSLFSLPRTRNTGLGLVRRSAILTDAGLLANGLERAYRNHLVGEWLVSSIVSTSLPRHTQASTWPGCGLPGPGL